MEEEEEMSHLRPFLSNRRHRRRQPRSEIEGANKISQQDEEEAERSSSAIVYSSPFTACALYRHLLL